MRPKMETTEQENSWRGVTREEAAGKCQGWFSTECSDALGSPIRSSNIVGHSRCHVWVVRVLRLPF